MSQAQEERAAKRLEATTKKLEACKEEAQKHPDSIKAQVALASAESEDKASFNHWVRAG